MWRIVEVCRGVWRSGEGVRSTVAVWRIVENCGELWRSVEECGGVWRRGGEEVCGGEAREEICGGVEEKRRGVWRSDPVEQSVGGLSSG